MYFQLKTEQAVQKLQAVQLPNISRSKVNQTIIFGQLIEYNTRDILLEKSQTKTVYDWSNAVE